MTMTQGWTREDLSSGGSLGRRWSPSIGMPNDFEPSRCDETANIACTLATVCEFYLDLDQDTDSDQQTRPSKASAITGTTARNSCGGSGSIAVDSSSTLALDTSNRTVALESLPSAIDTHHLWLCDQRRLWTVSACHPSIRPFVGYTHR